MAKNCKLLDGLRNKAPEPRDKTFTPPKGSVNSDATRSATAEMLTAPGPRVA